MLLWNNGHEHGHGSHRHMVASAFVVLPTSVVPTNGNANWNANIGNSITSASTSYILQLQHQLSARNSHSATALQSSVTEEDIETNVKGRRRGTGTGTRNRSKPMGFGNNPKNNHHNNNNRNGKIKNNTRIKTYKEIKEFRKAEEAAMASASSNVDKKSVSSTTASTSTSSRRRANASRKASPPSPSRSTQTTSKPSQPSSSSSKSKPPTQSQHMDVDVKQRIHNIHTIRSSRTFDEQKRSSDRLNKARVLLKDLTDTDVNRGVDVGIDADANIDANMEQEEGGYTNETPKSTTVSSASTTNTVPDRYWYNGNLQSGNGDYVTRWAQGVKVAEPLRKYDPISSEKLLFRQPAKWVVRNIQIGFPLATWTIGVAWDVLTKKEEVNRLNRAKQLLETISGLGPAIIKGGQALASRSDLLPSEYLDQLQKLQDDVPRFENSIALATVEAELGVDFNDVFELVEKEPIAAASIGQVYKARLRRNGDLVALKIQRPKCEDIIALDLFVLRWWSGVANILTSLFNRDINVQSIIDDFGELIYRELDYVAEAANAQRFSELYAGQVKDVFVPKVYSDLTTSKVLTMEWVEGFRLTDSDRMLECGLDRKKLVDTLVQCSLRQILGNGEFYRRSHGRVSFQCQHALLIFFSFMNIRFFSCGPARREPPCCTRWETLLP
jgi:hypothetical protein